VSLDNNKSSETHKATALASAYLDARGFKPIETEVPVREGWVSDLASFIYPTRTELRNLKLLGYKNILENVNDYDKFIYRYSTPLTAIVEIKITKADYKKDIDRKFDGIFPAHLCYFAYPKDIIEEPPCGWIGIELSKNCERINKITSPPLMRKRFTYDYTLVHPQNPGDIIDLIASVAIRREHRTRYSTYRDWLKAYKAEKNEKRKISDLREFCYAINLLLDGKVKSESLIDYIYIPPNHKKTKDTVFKTIERLKKLLQ